jgi:Ca2+-binding RTX toxin-like protein
VISPRFPWLFKVWQPQNYKEHVMFKFNKRIRKNARRLKNRKVSYQPLEDRKLLAADWAPEISFDDGVVEIQGSWFADNVKVEVYENGTADPSDDAIQIRANNRYSQKTLTLQKFNPDGSDRVERIVFRGEGGNDSFLNMSDRPATAYGGTGNDVLRGGSANDKLFGQDGNDWLLGFDGVDQLYGGAGDDYILGHDGDDVLRGDSGEDYLSGGRGEDHIRGGNDDDRIYGGDDDDELLGDHGNDYISGENGYDLIRGGSGNDEAFGGDGNDTILGDSGRDTLYGDKGNDLIHGGTGNDFIDGGWGDDMLIGGDDTDEIHAGFGYDTLIGGLVHIDPYAPSYNGNYVGGDTEDDCNDYLFSGPSPDVFILGDNGFFDIGQDYIINRQPYDSVVDLDPFGVTLEPWGVPKWNDYGHQSE